MQPLVLRVDRGGLYYLDAGDGDTGALDAGMVLTRAAAVLRRNPKTPVVVEADALVDYGSVIVGMSLLKQAGAAKVGLATRPIER